MDFGAGLNVIYGASDTGKSFILEAIDFGLGGGDSLRDIPERTGYDRLFLAISLDDKTDITLERATAGGKIKVHNGLHKAVPDRSTPLVLLSKHNATNDRNLSMFLLGKMGLAGSRIRKNQKGEANSLSFRNLAHLCLVPIGDIQKSGSPIESGNPIPKTAEMSVFKLLLTGVDDSASESQTINPDEKLSRQAKIEVIDELIANYHGRIESLVGEGLEESDLVAELAQIDSDLNTARLALGHTEEHYQRHISRRTSLRHRLLEASQRRTEIDELLARFSLLDSHYASDLMRLTALREAGSLVGALTAGDCPLCGARPDAQHLKEACDGNIDIVVDAADAETIKIARLRSELAVTVAQLQNEAHLFDEQRPVLEADLDNCNADIVRMNPELNQQRDSYAAHLDRRASVKSAVDYAASISELEARKEAFSTSQAEEPQESIVTELPTATLDRFSEHLESTLKSWNFPEADRVHFDKAVGDFNIGGKPRGSRGTGMRAITHAAFTVSLMEFALENNLAHPGFVVMDTPLLAYRKPEDNGKNVPNAPEPLEDDLRETDVKECFYRHLASSLVGQAIVLENSDPPDDIIQRNQTTFFTKNRSAGRYGFFPA